MFPKFLSFCKTQHRTPKINLVSTHICQKISKLWDNKNGTNLLFSDLSQEVIPLGFKLSKTKLTRSYLD